MKTRNHLTKMLSLFLVILASSANMANARQSATRNKAGIPYRNKYQRMASGSTHMVELRGGTLWAWGSNTHGELGIGNTTDQSSPVQVGAGSNWLTVACGQNFTLGIKSDGTLWAWGYNNAGQLGIGNNTDQSSPVQVGADNKWVKISSKGSHTAAIKSDGTMWAWGDNAKGELGLANNTNQNMPQQVGAGNTWVCIAAGGQHTLAIKADGTLWAWGFNGTGQLGLGNLNDQNSPVQVGAANWMSLAAGDDFSAAIKPNGTLFAWGNNTSGQLGLGNTAQQNSPVQVGIDNTWAVVKAGGSHCAGIKTNGTLWGWGNNANGQLGLGNNTQQTTPLQAGISNMWTDIDAGSLYGAGLKADGTLWTYGSNSNGQLGLGNTTDQSSPAQTGTALSELLNPLCGEYYSMALKTDGSAYAWGANNYGMFGNGTTILSKVPTTAGGNNWIHVSAGQTNTLAIKNDGTLWAWGSGGAGELGNGTYTIIQSTPVQVGNDNKWIYIATGAEFCFGIKSDGTLWSWGYNNAGQLGIGNQVTQNVPVQVGAGTDWIAVSAGELHAAGLKADGTVWTWGYNTHGELGLGNYTQPFSPTQVTSLSNDNVAISAGGAHTLVLKANGTIYGCGMNSWGQVGDNTTTERTSFVQVTGTWIEANCGYTHSSAIKSDGTFWTWGSNDHGELCVGTNFAQHAPTQVAVADVIQIAVGGLPEATGVIRVKRDQECMAGYNDNGMLGDGGTTARSILNCINVCASVTPTITITASPGNIVCAGTVVTFNASITGGGSIPVYVWKKNGNPVGGNQATYVANNLATGDLITCTLTSNEVCATTTTAISNSITMTVNPTVGPTINITANPGNTICSGVSVTFTATITNGGANPSYVWKKDNVVVGTNQNTYTDNGLTNGNVITCTLTSNAPCASPATLTSNSITMTVNPVLVPTISITANPGNTICAGTSVTFTASIANGGPGASYVWKKDNVVVGTNQNTYTDNGLTNGNVITCTLTSNATCANPTTATSNSITMTVNPGLVPTISITANPGNTICAGTAVTFTATITNGGPGASYVWKKDNVVVGTNQNSYTDNGLTNGNIITCELTSNATCANPTIATSNSITMTVNPVLVPTISITANPGNTICAGTAVTFTASVTNGGPGAIYVWKKDNVVVGTNQNSYTDNGLTNGNIITCELTSNATCANPTTVTSNSITMTVNPVVTPTISVTANPNGPICAGTAVTFTATTTNGGPTPAYQWYNGANPVGTNQDSYTDNGLNNGDMITCVLTSNATCASPAAVTSTAITMTVNPVLVPAISVTANPGNNICTGENVTFTANATNGGTPVYQWSKNGNPVGSNQPTYSDNLLNDGDIINCMLTSNATCANPTTATSNDITMSWNTVNSTLAGTIGNTETNALLLTGPAVDVRYTDCDLMATITPDGASPVNGNTTVKVTIDNTVSSYNNQPYLQRHFDIEPANNAGTATATVKLYAYQSEFDAYNTTAVAMGYPALPTSATDNGNVRISQFHGTGTAPGNYSGAEMLITPTVSWDATNSWWVMSFPVTGFSGFYIHTNSVEGALAVPEPTDISAINIGARNKVNWMTRNEKAGDMFTLERSADGRTFNSLSTVAGKGAASVYTYWDEQPVEGLNYYRVKHTDVSGQTNYTAVVTAKVQHGTAILEVWPNPAQDEVHVKVYGQKDNNATITLTDMAGKEIKSQAVDNNAADIDLRGLASGVYMLRYNSDGQSQVLKINKY